MKNEDFLNEDAIWDDVISDWSLMRTQMKLRMSLKAGLKIKEVHNEEGRRNQKKYQVDDKIS